MSVDFSKSNDGLVPVVVQDASTQRVLMLGFMNTEAFDKTQTTGRVVFYSRSRQRLWVKGETSKNYLTVSEIFLDCDSDTILIKANPSGPTCHTGADTCFGETNKSDNYLFELEKTIGDRRSNPTKNSYTSKLFAKGLNKIAQKVGEEAVELIIEAKDSNIDLFKAEAADLLYHLLVLTVEKNIALGEIIAVLEKRSKR